MKSVSHQGTKPDVEELDMAPYCTIRPSKVNIVGQHCIRSKQMTYIDAWYFYPLLFSFKLQD